MAHSQTIDPEIGMGSNTGLRPALEAGLGRQDGALWRQTLKRKRLRAPDGASRSHIAGRNVYAHLPPMKARNLRSAPTQEAGFRLGITLLPETSGFAAGTAASTIASGVDSPASCTGDSANSDAAASAFAA